MTVELKEHQREAVEKMFNGCILNGGVGVGKTHTSLAYYVEKVCGGSLDRSIPMKTPKNLLVITPAKKRNSLDWENTAIQFRVFVEGENSYGGVSITVDSWNNIQKYEGLKGHFIIFDEQKVVGSGAWAKTFIKLAKENEWVLLSATPGDTWMDYVPVFVANGFYRNRTDFIDQHVVYMFQGKYRKIRGYYGVKRLRALKEKILVDMPFDRHTTRNLMETYVDHDPAIFHRVWKLRWHVYEDRPLIDVGEMYRVGRRVVNEDPSRVEEIEKLFQKHKRMIIVYNFDYELELLRTLHTRLDVVVAEYNGHRHEPVPDTDEWLYLVQYQAGAEAWNCTTTDTIVFYSLTYSYKQFEQVQGRIDRLNTAYTLLNYYILMSKSLVDRKIWRSLREKRDFNEGKNVKFSG